MSCCFESFWRDPDTKVGLFNQPRSAEHLSGLRLPPQALREVCRQQRHLLPKCSALQPATLRRSLGKICLCVEPHPGAMETKGRTEVPPPSASAVMGIFDQASHVPRGGRRAGPRPLQALAFPQQETLTRNAPSPHTVEPQW